MNYSQSEVKRKLKEVASVSRKRRFRAGEWITYCGVILVITFLLITVFGLSGAVRGMIDSVPELDEIDILTGGQATKLYDSTGEEIQTLKSETSVQEYVPIGEIPKCVQWAVVAIEDKRFAEHYGVDMLGLLSYIYYDTFGDGKAIGDTSRTITQQLIENQILAGTNGTNIFENFCAAVKEQHLATQLEDSLGKQKILEYYLNTINLGQDVTGVQAAARRYFDKDISEVNISEAAVLAAAVTDSAEYHPVISQERNAQRRRLVLKSMLDEGYISEDDYEEALGDAVYTRIRNVNDTKASAMQNIDSYYVDAVVDQVIEDLKKNLGYSQTEAYNMLYHGGLRIYTCQESSLQKICEDVVNTERYYPKGERSGQSQLSFVLIEQSTGKVKAIVGGRGGKKNTSRGINRATELKRQPGAVLSTLSVYAPALDTAGMTLGDIQDDAEYSMREGQDSLALQEDGAFAGWVTLRRAAAGARSVPAVKTLQELSAQTGFGFLKRFGLTSVVARMEGDDGKIYSDLRPELAVGELSEGVINLELTAAYAAIANEGVYQKPRFYTRIVDRDGNVILENNALANRIIKKDTAWLLTDVMQDIVRDGNGKTAQFREIETAEAGNMANTALNTDSWFEGYTPYYTAGIWCGTDGGESRKKSDYYMVIWREIMERIHKHTKRLSGNFKKPADIIMRRICGKCGNLAVQGLCDEAVGGDTIYEEYFAMGTEPDRNCSCHVRYAFCQESGKLANETCMKEDVLYRVLLQKRETSETEDTKLTVAYNTREGACDVHTAEK